jgi:ferredoxin
MTRVYRVTRPTTSVSGPIERIDARDTAYGLAARGDYGKAAQKGVQTVLPEKYPLSAAQKNLIDHLALVEDLPLASRKAPIPQEPEILTKHIKSLALFLKADLVGICEVPSSAYYSHTKQGVTIEPRFRYGIVFVMRKNWKAMKASTGFDWMGDPISFQAYQHLGLVAETISNYIRRLGWDAEPQYGPSFVNKYSVLLPPLILAAGLGEVSRAGIILNPFLGLGFKAAAVLTSMPVVPDQPIDFGLQDFCRNCKICAENCPSKAISMGDQEIYNGYQTWKLNTKRCASFNFTNQKGTMCNRCVKSCPWSQPATWPHNLVRSLVTRSRLGRRIAIRGARWMDLGQARLNQKWWFDIKYKDDILIK